MGERADGMARILDGAALNWTAIFGAGFAAAPKHFVSVYRECSTEELMRIAREGLTVPAPEMRHPEVRGEMELLDRFRPPHIADKGISRLGAIYAVPTPETPRLPFRRERYVLELKVDPAEAFVGDMDFITCLIPFMGASRTNLDKYRGAFKKYWESVIPLGDFLAYYKEVRTADGAHWIARRGAPKRLPRTFFAPEILLMSPIIGQRHIRVLRKETGDDADCGHDHSYEGFDEGPYWDE